MLIWLEYLQQFSHSVLDELLWISENKIPEVISAMIMRCFPGFVNRAVVQLFSALTLSVKYGRKRGGMFWKSYSDEGNRRYMLRSGIWEESKNPKSCLTAKRRAGQLAFAQTIPAHRLTTPLRLLRSSDRFLQRRMSLLPLPQKVYLNRPLRFLHISSQKCHFPK